MYRLISVLALGIACTHSATAATPCPPAGLSIDGGSSVAAPCVDSSTPSQGGVTNGELFSTDFASGTSESIFDVAWGSKIPTVISDGSALKARSLRFDWDSGPENYNGVFKRVAGTRKKLHVRIRMKQGSGGTNAGIQKVIRFRPDIGGEERAAGTVNVQWGEFIFFGDDFGDGNNHGQSSDGTHGPDTFIGKWRYLEAMVDYTNPSVQHAAIWVDGTKVLDQKISLGSPMPSNLNMNGAMIFGTFNGPASDRLDYVDKVDFSANFMGVP